VIVDNCFYRGEMHVMQGVVLPSYIVCLSVSNVGDLWSCRL